MDIIRKSGKLFQLLRVPAWREAVRRHRVAAAVEHAALLRGRVFNVIVDVGANRGQFSLAARHWQPRARIVAFEPLPSAANVYAAVFRGQADVVLHCAAIAPEQGVAEMQLSRREDSSSLLPISRLQSEHFPGTEAAGTARIDIAPLTRFIVPDDLQGEALLKIDVQGFELEVLKASLPLLPLFQSMYVEASFVPLYEGQALAHEVIDFLHQNGFALVGVYNPSFAAGTGKAIQADLLFTARKDRLPNLEGAGT